MTTPAWFLTFVLFATQTAAKGPVAHFTGTTDNVSSAGDTIKIDLLNWSTDADRDQLLKAWTLTATPAPAARGAGGGGRGGGGGGGRGRGGAAPEPVAPETPESSLAAALQKASTVGILWTSESTGYSIRFAYRLPQPDGSEHVILVTDRRLGSWNTSWRPAGSASPTNYEFSLIELRLNTKGEGEGKSSLTGKVTIDSSGKTLALDGYSTLPVVLKSVKRQN